MPEVVSLILAGGRGSRLYPLTRFRSKPAVPLAGRFRLIDITVSNCIHSNLQKIFVITQFASVSLHRHIFTTYRFDQFHIKDFITILSAQQTLDKASWYQGTADAVRQNFNFFENAGDIILILSGDHLYRMDYRHFIDSHIKTDADISIAVTPVPSDKASEFGVMKVDRAGCIVDFFEKPKHRADIERMAQEESLMKTFGLEPSGRTHLASMGIYVFKKQALKNILFSNQGTDFGKEIIPSSLGKEKVCAYFFDGYWEDIGNIRTFFDAHMDLCSTKPRFNFYDENKPIFTHARFLPGSKINNAVVEHSILCEGSIVDRCWLNSSIIGVRSKIGQNSKIERTIVMGADYFETPEDIKKNRLSGQPDVGIGNDCEIRNTIIDKNARLGHGVKLINARGIQNEKSEKYCIVDGIIVVEKNAVLPDGLVV